MASGPGLAHVVRQETLLFFTKGQFQHRTSPLEWLAPAAPGMRAHGAGLVQKPTGLSPSSHPLSLPASVPATLGPFSLQEPTLLLGLFPNRFPSLVHTPFPLSQVNSQLTFPTAYEGHFLQEAFPGLPSRPDSP